MIGAAAAAATLAAATALYTGSAQKLLPPAKEAAYKTVVASLKQKAPTGTAAHGFRNGWAVLYEKGTKAAPVEAAVIVSVYSSKATATAAWTASCASCKTHIAARGMQVKFVVGTENGKEVVQNRATCGNVLVAVTVEGSEASSKMSTDGGLFAGLAIGRAVALGMSGCTV